MLIEKLFTRSAERVESGQREIVGLRIYDWRTCWEFVTQGGLVSLVLPNSLEKSFTVSEILY